MASKSSDPIPEIDAVETSEATIEIKIKTLDSQTYTLKVDKEVISLIALRTVPIKILVLSFNDWSCTETLLWVCWGLDSYT